MFVVFNNATQEGEVSIAVAHVNSICDAGSSYSNASTIYMNNGNTWTVQGTPSQVTLQLMAAQSEKKDG